MMHRSPRAFAPGASSRGLFLAVALLAIVMPARADFTLKDETASSGLAGFGNGTRERTTVIGGDRSRTERSFAENPGNGPVAVTLKTGPGMRRARTDAQEARAQDHRKKDEQEDAAAADNAGDAIAHGNVSGALGGRIGHRLGKAFRKKAEASTTPGAGSSGAQGGGLTITTGFVGLTTGSAGGSHEVPADHKKVERKQQ